MSSVADENGCDKMIKIKTKKNEDLAHKLSTENSQLKVDVPENTTTAKYEVKDEKKSYKEESSWGNNEYFEENDIKTVIKSDEDLNTLNTKSGWRMLGKQNKAAQDNHGSSIRMGDEIEAPPVGAVEEPLDLIRYTVVLWVLVTHDILGSLRLL